MRCERCGKSTVIEIKMQVAGEDLVFRRCGNCETQEWQNGEESLRLGEVLDIARMR